MVFGYKALTRTEQKEFVMVKPVVRNYRLLPASTLGNYLELLWN